MVVVGLDGHKRTHTAVAKDAVGRVLGQFRIPARSVGHQHLREWAHQIAGDEPVLFAVEERVRWSV
jgi:transposase